MIVAGVVTSNNAAAKEQYGITGAYPPGPKDD
jgi:hypothetical protein